MRHASRRPLRRIFRVLLAGGLVFPAAARAAVFAAVGGEAGTVGASAAAGTTAAPSFAVPVPSLSVPLAASALAPAVAAEVPALQALPPLPDAAPTFSPAASGPAEGRARPPEAGVDGSAFFDGVRGAGTSVTLVDGPARSREARAALVVQARSTVRAAYYEVRMDAGGLGKLKLLRDAARRGLDVRLVVDAWGSRIGRAMLRHLVDAGVQVRVYHPFRLGRPSWIWRRLHDKWLIVDGEKAILGDRNMTGDFFADGDGRDTRVSREALVAGRAAAQAHAHAADVWNGSEVFAPRGLRRVSVAAARAAGDRLDAFEPAAGPRAGFAPLETPRAHPSDLARFVHDPVVRSGRLDGTAREVLRLILGARSTIVIENAYVVLPEIFQRAVARAVARGVRVIVITNAPQAHNTLATRLGYGADVPMLARLGMELWEYQGPGTLHSKAMVVDGRRLYLGSFNLDERSLRLNTESGLLDDNPALAKDLLSQIAAAQGRSVLVARGGAVLTRRRPSVQELLLRPLAALFRRMI